MSATSGLPKERASELARCITLVLAWRSEPSMTANAQAIGKIKEPADRLRLGIVHPACRLAVAQTGVGGRGSGFPAGAPPRSARQHRGPPPRPPPVSDAGSAARG